jgi:outer membrane protein assembly factor BamB
MRAVRFIALSCITGLLISACSSDDNKVEISREGRVSVLQLEQSLRPDITDAERIIRVPPPRAIAAWPTSGGNATHSLGHVALAATLEEKERHDIGEGTRNAVPLAAPVVVGNRVFALDAAAQVTAFDSVTGNTTWTVDLLPESEDTPPSFGGLAHSGNLLIVAAGFNEVVALNPDTGSVIWRTNLPAPVRSAPTVANNRVYAVTLDNELFALHASDGKKLWQHGGLTGGAMLIGGSSPAVMDDTVIAAYSSGELFALRPENGRVLWSESLAAVNRVNAAASLTDITASPVVLDDAVYSIGHSGRLVAINRLNGRKLWEREIGGVTTPWVAGEFLFVLTNNAQLLCLNRLSGKIFWLTQLDKFEDKEDKKDPITWTAPILAGDRLLLGGSNGQLLAVSPYTGGVLGSIEQSAPLLTAPIVANRTLYLLRQDGVLAVFR